MANIFRYGPYTFVSANGILGPGEEMSLAFAPWDWWGDSVTVTAHPFALAGADRVSRPGDCTPPLDRTATAVSDATSAISARIE